MKYGKKVHGLLIRLKNGENCFRELYDLVYKHLLVVAKIYLIDKSLADDVLSEALTSVYKNIKSFNEDKNGYSWLCKIVQNEAYDINKKTQIYEELNDNTKSPLDEIAVASLKCDIDMALLKLSEKERELIILRFYQGKTFAEIAEVKNVSPPMIHKSINKVLKKLEKLL